VHLNTSTNAYRLPLEMEELWRRIARKFVAVSGLARHQHNRRQQAVNNIKLPAKCCYCFQRRRQKQLLSASDQDQPQQQQQQPHWQRGKCEVVFFL